MVRVSLPIHLDVAGVCGKLLLVLLPKRERVVRLGQQAVEELDITRVERRIEVVVARVAENEHAAFAYERLAAIEVEEVPRPHHLDEKRVQDRVHVVGRDVGNTDDQNVALPFHFDRVLVEATLESLVVYRIRSPGVARDHLERRRDVVEKRSLHRSW